MNHFVKNCYVKNYNVKNCYVKNYNVKNYNVKSYYVKSYYVKSYYVKSYYVKSYYVKSYFAKNDLDIIYCVYAYSRKNYSVNADQKTTPRHHYLCKSLNNNSGNFESVEFTIIFTKKHYLPCL